ncbi:MAG TPA: phenylalanine--tRNA ligase subunit beta [Dehalococcoidia bacterium]|nr:phenylalanine--tRNA ligase subunit beta [Dehalococcoidia bacterium]
MRVPLRWLAEYVDLPAHKEDLARRLTTAGVEVGEIIRTGGQWENIVVGEVVKVDPHPNADRLSLPTIRIGNGEERQVVCGAPNIAAGQKIAYAAVGARLIDGHTGEPTTLKKAKIRGVESQGMVCSEKELGLSDEHEGIRVLPEDSPVGADVAEILGDTIFDFDLTPNRPDLFSILGIAREVAALTGAKFRDPPIQYEEKGAQAKSKAKVTIQAPDLCSRYVAAIIENIEVGPSPDWMQEHLTAAGLRPINNVVDITNYVMLEMGQPLHAFDYDDVARHHIIVCRAAKNGRIRLLDRSRHKLNEDVLLIADAERAVGIAGVMGGHNSEVTSKTKTVLLEAANFNGPNIRRTSQALKIRTDASTRFEKGLSPHLPPIAAARAVRLMVEHCGGRAARGLIDVNPGEATQTKVTLKMERLVRVLGIEPTDSEVRGILTSLGFGARWMPPDRFIVRVPYWRTDVNIADDVIEEIARIIGYDQLPTSMLRGEIPPLIPQPRRDLRERIRDALTDAGMQEIITYSMTDLDSLRKVLPKEDLQVTQPLRLANPLSRQWEYARTTLRHALLETLAANVRGNHELVSLFETARIYIPRDGDLPDEIESLCGVVSGRQPDRWGRPVGDLAGFYEAKSRVEHLLGRLCVSAGYREAVDFAYLPGRTAEIFAGDARIGLIGEVHPRITEKFDIDRSVAMFELDLDAVLPHVPEIPNFQPIPQHPALEEDLAVIVRDDVSAAHVQAVILASNLVRAARVFDVYSGDPIPKGKKSLAFAITYQAEGRTLTDEDVAKERRRITERLRNDLDAELRG